MWGESTTGDWSSKRASNVESVFISGHHKFRITPMVRYMICVIGCSVLLARQMQLMRSTHQSTSLTWFFCDKKFAFLWLFGIDRDQRSLRYYATHAGWGNDCVFRNNAFPHWGLVIQQHWSVLVQVMACRLIGTKPLPGPMVTYCKLELLQNLQNFNIDVNIFSQENALRYRLQVIVHFV